MSNNNRTDLLDWIAQAHVNPVLTAPPIERPVWATSHEIDTFARSVAVVFYGDRHGEFAGTARITQTFSVCIQPIEPQSYEISADPRGVQTFSTPARAPGDVWAIGEPGVEFTYAEPFYADGGVRLHQGYMTLHSARVLAAALAAVLDSMPFGTTAAGANE